MSAFLIFGIGVVTAIYGCKVTMFGRRNNEGESIFAGLFCAFFGIVIMTNCNLIGNILSGNVKSPHEIQEELESEAVESYDSGSEVYINGKQNNDIDINGINLDKYNIKTKNGKIYLIERDSVFGRNTEKK